MALLKVNFATTEVIPEFEPKYQGFFVLDGNDDLYLGLKDRWKQFSMGKSSNLELGEGLIKNVDDDKITILIDEDYIKKKIESYIEKFVDSNWEENKEKEDDTFDILKKTINYIIDDENYNWYDFSNADKGIIILNEPMDVPLNPANFGDKYIPSFTMEFDSLMDLSKTPIFEIEGFTLYSCAFNFKFVDINGKYSSPVICGKTDNPTKYIINTNSHQERTSGKISSMSYAGYTEYSDASTKQTIDNAVSSLVQEYIDNGSYDSNKCAKAKINILTDMEDGLTFEEGFDMKKVTKLCVQLVENYDKDNLSWKSRYKAQIFNKLQFSKVEETI